jgi:hypothetical protein
MSGGVEMRLYIGPAAPLPVSPEILDALVSVSVTNATPDAPGVFQLVFDIDQRSELTTLFVLSGGVPIPMIRVVIAARMNGADTILIDGVMTHHEVTPGPALGTARLSCTGEDLSRVMDYIPFDFIRYPAMPDFARVALILAKYAFLGVVPAVVPSVLLDVPLPTSKIPQHRGKDLSYIKSLAERVGYVFMMRPGLTVGQSFAYWGPDLRFGEVQPALNLDMDAYRNIQQGSASFDTQKGSIPIVVIQNPETKAPIPIPIVVNPVLNPPLGAIPPIPLRVDLMSDTAHLNPMQAAMIGMARAAKSQVGPLRVTGTLDVTTYGRLLEPHKLVGLRGFGPAYTGLYYVERVTTAFNAGSLTQDFVLSRNGLVSTVEKVPA